MCICVHIRVSFDSWESIPAPLVVMETAGTVCVSVFFHPKNIERAGSRSGPHSDLFSRSCLIHFFHFLLFVSTAVNSDTVRRSGVTQCLMLRVASEGAR